MYLIYLSINLLFIYKPSCVCMCVCVYKIKINKMWTTIHPAE